MENRRVLFVCTGNTCRSAMAEALMRHEAGKRGIAVEVSSAGVMADEGHPASLGALDAMARRGVDLEAHRAVMLREDHVREADVVLCMTRGHLQRVTSLYPEHAHKAKLLLEAALGRASDVADPYGGSAETYDSVATVLNAAVQALLDAYGKEEKS